MDKQDKIYVAGHAGLVGSAIVRRLRAMGFENIICRTSMELDLTHQAAVDAFFAEQRPDHVFLCAAKVGGIHANDTYPASFIGVNLAIQTNVIHSAFKYGAAKLMFMGSGCIYPRECPQPIQENYLLTGPLEKTNEWYAVAKIAGLKMAQAYRRQYGFNAVSVMPANLYGPEDNFDYATSHVVPALIRKFHDAKITGADTVSVWGDGSARREFLHIDDAADGITFVMNNYSGQDHLNMGFGEDVTIAELAANIREVVGCSAKIVYDLSKPNGTPRKLLDSSKLKKLGWTPSTTLEQGLRETYTWFLENLDKFRCVSGS